MSGRKLQKSVQNIYCSMWVGVGLGVLMGGDLYAAAYQSTCWLKLIENEQAPCCIAWSTDVPAIEVCQAVKPDVPLSKKDANTSKTSFNNCTIASACEGELIEVTQGTPITKRSPRGKKTLILRKDSSS